MRRSSFASSTPAFRVPRHWLAALAVGLVALFIHGFRLSAAPDLLSDEGIYHLVAQNIAVGRGAVDDTGTFFWHPPLYMLIEAAYLWAFGLLQTDTVSAIHAARWLNVVFSALTGALLVLLGTKLLHLRAGLLMAGLFILDAYVQRINRRNMLETLAMLLLIIGLYLFFTHRPRLGWGRQLAAGLAFGLATLTKEFVGFGLLIILGFALWSRRGQLVDAVRVSAVAVAVYAIYPAWAIAIGEVDRFLRFRVGGLSRFLNFAGTPIEPGVRLPSPGPGILDRLLVLVEQYAMSYALLAVGAALTLLLVLRGRHLPAARFLVVWSGMSYAVLAFGLTLGRISDHFFYYLIVPAIVVTGYAVAVALDAATRAPTRTRGWRWSPPGGRWRAVGFFVIAPLLAMSLYNASQWVDKYAIGTDDSFAQVVRYVHAHVPTGETIVAGNETSNFLLRPYDIKFYREPTEIRENDVRFFILSSKDAWGHYNAMTPEFYAWVMNRTDPLIEREGVTFWTTGLYYRNPSEAEDGESASQECCAELRPP